MKTMKRSIASVLCVLLAVTFPMPNFSYAGDTAQWDQNKPADNEQLRSVPATQTTLDETTQKKIDGRDLSTFFYDSPISTPEKEEIVKEHETIDQPEQQESQYQSEQTEKGVSLDYAVALAQKDAAPAIERVDTSTITREALEEMMRSEVECAIFFVEVKDGDEEGKGQLEAFFVTSGDVGLVRAHEEILKTFDFQNHTIFAIHNHPGEDSAMPTVSTADLESALEAPSWEVACNQNGCTAYDQDGMISDDLSLSVAVGRVRVLEALYKKDAGEVAQADYRNRLNSLVVQLDELQKTLAQGVEGIILRAEATPIVGATTLAAKSYISNLPAVSMTGNYITALEHSGGIAYRYDVRNYRTDETVATLKNSSGTMVVPNNFTFHMKVAVTTASGGTVYAVNYPATVRVKLTDNAGQIIEIDARATSDQTLSYTANLTSINAAFNVAMVEKIEFIENQTICGTNRRAEVTVDIDGLLKDVALVSGLDTSANPKSTVSGFPTLGFTSTSFISAVTYDQGFGYRFDVRDSTKRELTAVLQNTGGTMNVGDEMVLWMMAQNATSGASPEINSELTVLVKLTDSNNNVVAARLVLEKNTMKAFKINLANDYPSFLRGEVKKIEIIQNQILVGGVQNARAEIIGSINGLVSTQVPIEGVSSGAAPSAISNSPTSSVSGQFISKFSLDGGVAYNYDVRYTAGEAVLKVANSGGVMAVPAQFVVQMQALATTSNPQTITYPVKVLVRLKDSANQTVTAVLNLRADMRSFTIDLTTLNSSFNINSVSTIEFVQSPLVSGTNKRAKINLLYNGTSAETPITGQEIGSSETPTDLVGGPVTKVSGRFITELTETGGAAYNYDIRRSASDTTALSLENSSGNISVSGTSLVVFMQAEALDVPLTSPVKTQVRLTDASGNVISAILNVETTLKKFTIDLTSNTAFDRSNIKSIVFVQSNTISAINRRGRMHIKIGGLGEKVAQSVSKDPATLQITHQLIDTTNNRVYKQFIYQADDQAAYNAITNASDFPTPPGTAPAGLKLATKVILFDTDNDGRNETKLIIDVDNLLTTKVELNDSQDPDSSKPQKVKRGEFITLAQFDAATPAVLRLIYNLSSSEQLIVHLNDDGTRRYATYQKNLGSNRTLIATPVTESPLYDSVSSQKPTSWAAIANTTVYTLQETSADGKTTKTATPVNSDTTSTSETVYSKQVVERSVTFGGKTGDWVQVWSDLDSSYNPVAGTSKFSRQLAVIESNNDVTYVIGNYADSTFSGPPSGEALSYSRQVVEKGVSYGSKAGDWMKIYGDLTATFGHQTSSTYSRQLVEKDAQDVETGKTFIIAGYDQYFAVTSNMKYSIQEELKDTTHGGKTGDWMNISSGLTDTFAGDSDSEYSLQMTDTSGVTYVVSDLTSAFDSTVAGAKFAMQENVTATHGGKTGVWTRVTAKLSNTFGAQAGVTEYSLQMTDTAGVTYVISDLTSAFDSTVAGAKFATQENVTATHGGKTGVWTKVAAKLSNTFAAVAGVTEYSLQFTDTAGVTYLISDLTSAFDSTVAGAKFATQENVTATHGGKTGVWTKVAAKLSNAFGAQAGVTEYSLQLTDTAGVTYLISDLTAAFDSTVAGATFATQETETATYGGKTGVWTKISADLSSTFTVAAESTFSRQLVEDETTYLINYPDNSFDEASESLKLTTQKNLGDNKTLIASPLNLSFVGDDNTQYSVQIDIGNDQTVIITNVDSLTGAATADSEYSLQKKLAGSEVLTYTKVDSTTYDTTATSQTMYDRDINADGKIEQREVFDGVCEEARVLAGTCVSGNPSITHVQTIYFKDADATVFDVFSASPSLKVHDITDLPSAGLSQVSYKPNTASATINSLTRGMEFVFTTGDASAGEGWVSGAFAYSGTADLSGFEQLVFGIKRTAGDVRRVTLKLEDNAGLNTEVELVGIGASEKIWAVSTASLAGIDLTKVKNIQFIVKGDNVAGTLEITRMPDFPSPSALHATTTLAPSDISSLPAYEGIVDINLPNLTNNSYTSGRNLIIDYKALSASSYAGGGFNYGASGVDLSALNQIVFALRGDSSDITFEIKDTSNNVGTIKLTGIESGVRKLFAINTALFSSVNMGAIQYIHFIVDNQSGAAIAAGTVEVSYVPTAARKREVQLIVDYGASNQTTVVDFDRYGNNAYPQRTYSGEYTTVADLKTAISTAATSLKREVYMETVGRVIVDQGPFVDEIQFNIDHTQKPAETTVTRFDADGEIINPQEVFSGVIITLEDYLSSNSGRTVIVLSDTEQLIQDAANNETIYVKFDSLGNVSFQEYYVGIKADRDDLVATDLKKTVYFLGDNHQLEWNYGTNLGDSGVEGTDDLTIDRFFNATTGMAAKINVYGPNAQHGLIMPDLEETPEQYLLETTYVIDDTHQRVIDYQPLDDAGYWGEVRDLTVDELGNVILIATYDGIPMSIPPYPTGSDVTIPKITVGDVTHYSLGTGATVEDLSTHRGVKIHYDTAANGGWSGGGLHYASATDLANTNLAFLIKSDAATIKIEFKDSNNNTAYVYVESLNAAQALQVILSTGTVTGSADMTKITDISFIVESGAGISGNIEIDYKLVKMQEVVPGDLAGTTGTTEQLVRIYYEFDASNPLDMVGAPATKTYINYFSATAVNGQYPILRRDVYDGVRYNSFNDVVTDDWSEVVFFTTLDDNGTLRTATVIKTKDAGDVLTSGADPITTIVWYSQTTVNDVLVDCILRTDSYSGVIGDDGGEDLASLDVSSLGSPSTTTDGQGYCSSM